MARRKATVQASEQAVVGQLIVPANGVYYSPVCDFARPQANRVIAHLRKVHGESWKLAKDGSIVRLPAAAEVTDTPITQSGDEVTE